MDLPKGLALITSIWKRMLHQSLCSLKTSRQCRASHHVEVEDASSTCFAV